jgi:hypothetical protein
LSLLQLSPLNSSSKSFFPTTVLNSESSVDVDDGTFDEDDGILEEDDEEDDEEDNEEDDDDDDEDDCLSEEDDDESVNGLKTSSNSFLLSLGNVFDDFCEALDLSLDIELSDDSIIKGFFFSVIILYIMNIIYILVILY